jgi:DNA-binding NarL/FixJ family response regulator
MSNDLDYVAIPKMGQNRQDFNGDRHGSSADSLVSATVELIGGQKKEIRIDVICPTNIRVAIFERTQMSCELMSQALEASSYCFRVVATGTTSEVKDSSRLEGATAVVISSTLREGPLSGLTLLRRLTKDNRDLNCVLLIDRDEHQIVVEAFRSGAVGVFEREQTYDQLCKCIFCVQDGQVWANSKQVRYVLDALSGGLPPYITDAKGRILLTERELEIVSKVAEGMKNREIAELLHVSEHTIKNHLYRIFDRLGIASRTELILYHHGQRCSANRRNDSRHEYPM